MQILYKDAAGMVVERVLASAFRLRRLVAKTVKPSIRLQDTNLFSAWRLDVSWLQL